MTTLVRSRLFTAKPETIFNLVKGTSRTALVLRPKRRRSWTEASLAAALQWLRDTKKSGVLMGSNTAYIMKQIEPELYNSQIEDEA